MTLHIKDGPLDVDYTELYDYSQLDVDYDLRFWKPVSLRGSVWIDVDDAEQGVCDIVEYAIVDDDNVLLTVDNDDDAGITIANLRIDADDPDYGGVDRRLRFSGGKINADQINIIGSQAVSDPVAKAGLQLVFGEIIVRSLHVYGGNSFSKRADMDLDQDMTVSETTDMDQMVSVAVAPGKTFNTKKLVLGIDTELSITGETGGGMAQGKLVAQD